MSKILKESLINTNTSSNKLHILSMKNDESIAGRIKLKLVSHVIHDNITDVQENNINWQEEHVRNNINSAIGMSLKVSYDWSGLPTGHGCVGRNPEGEVTDDFVDIVGSTISADIEEVEFEDGIRKCLVVEAYIDTAVHQGLGNWLKAKMFDGKGIDTSVEIVAKRDNDYIVADNRSTDRVFIPKEYDYIGQAILTYEPADKYAKIIQITNERNEENMNKDEQIKKLTNDLKIKEQELNEKIKENEKLEEDKKTSKKISEEKEIENKKSKEELEEKDAKISELENYKKEAEKKEVLSEFNKRVNSYDEEILNSFKEEIEDFKSNPTLEKKDKIINSLNSEYVERHSKAKRESDIYGNDFMLNHRRSKVELKDDLDAEFLK